MESSNPSHKYLRSAKHGGITFRIGDNGGRTTIEVGIIMADKKDRFGIGSLILCTVSGFILSTPRQLRPQQNTHLRYDTPGTTLQGIVIERNAFGPPGYGESPSRDSQVKIFVLKLANSVSVEPAPNAEANGSASLDPAMAVHEIQLFVPHSQMSSLQKLIGHVITVKGTLNESITASHYTKVWLDVAMFSDK